MHGVINVNPCQSDGGRFICQSEAIKQFGLTATTIRRERQNGRLSYRTTASGHRYLYAVTDLDKLRKLLTKTHRAGARG